MGREPAHGRMVMDIKVKPVVLTSCLGTRVSDLEGAPALSKEHRTHFFVKWGKDDPGHT